MSPTKETDAPLNKAFLRSKFLGAMVGSAIGDAVGELAFQFPTKDHLQARLEQVSELRYTDDTAMAIGLAESISQNGDINEQHLGKTFSDNFAREPWRGYASGPPTIFSLVNLRGITYSDAAKSLFGGQGSLGNGAAMRVVPVGLFFHDSPDLYEKACASARVTHAHSVGMDGAAVQALAVSQVVGLNPEEGFASEKLIRNLLASAGTPEIKGKMENVQDLVMHEHPPDAAACRIGRSVAVYESMPFAIYCFFRYPKSFKKCLYCAILNGGDRDTLGAMAGAISGAYLGIEAIPQGWQKKLENRAHIEKLAYNLVEIRKT